MKKFIITLTGIYLNTLALFAPKLAGKKGFEVFCSPFSPPVKHYHQDFFDTAAKESFESDGNTIQTYRWGTGKTKVLFLHGWKSHTFRWKHYINSFSKEDFTLYAMDAPAHGLSSGKMINIILYANAIEKFIERIKPVDAVVTHSFGGFAALYSLHNHPELPVKKLVLMGVPGEVGEFLQLTQKFLKLSEKTMKAVRKHFEEVVHHSPEYFSSTRFAAGMKLPGLIIHDETDLEAPYAHAVKIHKGWENSELVTTNGLGHHLKSPEVLNRVKTFVSTASEIVDRKTQKVVE